MPPRKGVKRVAKAITDKRKTKKAKHSNGDGKSPPAIPGGTKRRSTVDEGANKESERKEVQWVLPEDAGKKKDYDENTARTFAPLLYGQPWAALINLQTGRLQQAPFRSPVFRKPERVSQRDLDRAHTKNKSSGALRRFFAQIQADTSNDWSVGGYNFSNFRTAFSGEGNHAVVATENSHPFMLDQDYAMEV